MNRKRGRVSSAELMSPNILELYPRLPPPAELKGEARAMFVKIVKSEPPDWFTQASTTLLAQYCRHAVEARRIAGLLEGCDPEADLKQYARLLAAARGESATLASLGTKLRLTPQATRNHRGNRPRIGPKPWEWEPSPHER
jgi:hypothetical protein